MLVIVGLERLQQRPLHGDERAVGERGLSERGAIARIGLWDTRRVGGGVISDGGA
jgi:hypothetical protein